MTNKAQSRTETDSMGSIDVPADKLWGAQTQRSLHFFAIGENRFPITFIKDFVLIKKAAALSNKQLAALDGKIADLIIFACEEILSGKYHEHFPLSLWQTGSGTQTNMNVNEVIANIANVRAGSALGSKSPVHPNDHVNCSQSSNDVFPTVMHLTAMRMMKESLLPKLVELLSTMRGKANEFSTTIKTGRTHMMDATPVTLGQEFSGYAAQLEFSQLNLEQALTGIKHLAIGGTAVGTGLNSDPEWADTVTTQISVLSGFIFSSSDNKFSQLASHDALAHLHGTLNLLATSLYKIASDIRLMNSGPRCGLAEITLPANEPGSSIMPGKVNPTQIEALTMVCLRVMGNNTSVSMANSQGQFELNVYKPLIIHCLMESMTLLSDAMRSFTQHCLSGIAANQVQLDSYIDRSLMLVTALVPLIGYDQASKAAQYAMQHNTSLRQAVLSLKLLDEAAFDKAVNPAAMLGKSAN